MTACKEKDFTGIYKNGRRNATEPFSYVWEVCCCLAKNLDVIILIDFYGDMLTEKQHAFLNYYYNDDLSLSEIAANEGITRQGVRDAIKRAEVQLHEMEQRLGLVSRFESMKSGLEEIMSYADEIGEYNRTHTLSREVNDCTAKIKAVAQTLIMEG